MENFVHASVSHAALAEFGRNARAVGVQLHALEIFEKNECMVRWAVAPYSCGDKREMYSLSKSFTSTAAGVAFGMGKLHPDDRVLDWFPEYASLCSGDARWSRLRVGHVLSMNTGHAACVMPQAAFSQDGVRAFPMSRGRFSPIIPPPPISRQSWCAVPRAARFPSFWHARCSPRWVWRSFRG